MSNSLAIAAVTATLYNLLFNQAKLLDDGQEDPLLTDLGVTSKPLDLARGTGTANQLNIFLYQTILNAAWRNSNPRQAGSPPLGLNLYYLITAYGKNDEDIASHRLLGRAMRVLHDRAILGANEIKDAIADSGLDVQIEKVKIVPQPLSLEEISKLWAAFQSPYRLSAAYEASVILIESTKLPKAPLPVLTISQPPPPPAIPEDLQSGVTVLPSLPISFATLLGVKFPGQEPSAELGDTITLSGDRLLFESSTDGNTIVELSFKHRLSATLQPSANLISNTATEIQFQLPDDSDTDAVQNWPAGAYTVSAKVTIIVNINGQPKEKQQFSNELPFLLAPKITNFPVPVEKEGDKATITVTVAPQVWPEQQVFLLLGSLTIPAQPHPNKTDTLIFNVQPAPTGTFFIRLRVDGTDSHLIQLVNNQLQFNQDLQVNIS